MRDINLITDALFLIELNKEKVKETFTKITILDKDEQPLRSIISRTSGGSISVAANSPIKRTGSISVVAEESENDLTNIDRLFTANKKIKIETGLRNTLKNQSIGEKYDEIIWFKQGVFVIVQPGIQHTSTGVNINLQIKDKMCLLNGECGGTLPTSVTFHEYDQIRGLQRVDYVRSNSSLITYLPKEPNQYTVYGLYSGNEPVENKNVNYDYFFIWDAQQGWTQTSKSAVGKSTTIKERIFDIIQTLVVNYGGESLNNVIINDVPLEIKASVRYIGKNKLYFIEDNGMYTLDADIMEEYKQRGAEIRVFNYNEDCGYIYTDFTYPGELVSGIGDNICTILDKIKNQLGNFEYFYDEEGRFVFQEIKNYLNTTYSPALKYDKEAMKSNNFLNELATVLNEDDYWVDFSNASKSIYNFEQGSELISSYSNTPNYGNIKNDYHIWGKAQNGSAIHYHLAIKEKPQKEEFTTRAVVFEKDENGLYTGKLKLANDFIDFIPDENGSGTLTVKSGVLADVDAKLEEKDAEKKWYQMDPKETMKPKVIEAQKTLILGGDEVKLYTPQDWRAELYLRGLEKKARQERPDIYEQELLDLFDLIYDMKAQEYKDVATRPNELKYWIDYIDPSLLEDISVDTLGTRIEVKQEDKIKKIYDVDIPNIIMINNSSPELVQQYLKNKCDDIGQRRTNVDSNIIDNTAIGTVGYTAREIARDLLYQYTDYTSSISLTSIPIYYLDVNRRITVNDKASGINGDYIIKSFNIPLDGKSMMSISATRALNRI